MADVTSQPGGDGTERTAAGPEQSADRTKPNFVPSQEESTVVTQWLQRVQRAEEKPERKEWFDELTVLRGYVRGTKHNDKSATKLVRTNMVFATMAAQVPELYAKNPKLEAQPTDAVPEAQMGVIKKFASTAERLLDQCLVVEGRLKKRMKSGIRSTSTTGYGVLKLLYQEEYRGDPIAVRRIEDTQDNLARVEGLAAQLKKEDDVSKLAAERDELKANLKALTSGNEVRMFKGFTVDRMRSEDFIVLDDSIVEFDEYEDAGALGHFIWKTVKEAKELFNMELTGATRYGRPRELQAQTQGQNTPSDEMYICIVEIWDKRNGVVRTTAKGMNRWLLEPYAPRHAPQRWYPFYVIGYNLTEDQWRPISDVELLMGLQDEYNDTRTNYADARKDAVPKRVFRKSGGLTEEDIKALRSQGNREWIGVEGNPQNPLSNDIAQFEGVAIKPEAYDTTLIRNDMDMVAGRSDASRANLIKPKTATEAEIMQEAMQTRMGERRDVNEDVMSDMASATLEIALRCFTKAEVQQLAGPDCEWPDTPQGAEECFRNVSVRVRAGSSGKPNAMKEREQWSTLLPIVEKTMQTVGELRMNGNYELADQALELLKETLRRFDEHLDLDAIIPPVEKDENGKPVAQQQAAMELIKVKEQLQLCQEELQKCQQELQKAQAGEASKMEQARLDKELAEAQAARDAQAAIEEAQRTAAAEEAKAQREHDAAQAEAERQARVKVAEAETKAEEMRIADARAQRELQAKRDGEREIAMIKAAAEIVKTTMMGEIQAESARETAQISAKAEGAAKEKEKKEQAAEQKSAAASEEKTAARFEQAMGALQKTIGELSKAMGALSKDSSERTALIKQHLAE